LSWFFESFKLNTQRTPFTIPAYTQAYYENIVDIEVGRFSDLPAFRSFLGYQVRLVSALISRARGYALDSPEAIARLNLHFRAADCDDLIKMVWAMAKSALITPEVAEKAVAELGQLRSALTVV
jgi:hypothetical protein